VLIVTHSPYGVSFNFNSLDWPSSCSPPSSIISLDIGVFLRRHIPPFVFNSAFVRRAVINPLLLQDAIGVPVDLAIDESNGFSSPHHVRSSFQLGESFVPARNPVILRIVRSRHDNLSAIRQQMTYFHIIIDVVPFVVKPWRTE